MSGEDDEPSEPIPFADVCAVLVRDPFHLTIPQIADLTDEQLLRIYFRADPRDTRIEQGASSDAVALPYRELYERTWAARGMMPQQIEEKWQKDLASGEIDP